MLWTCNNIHKYITQFTCTFETRKHVFNYQPVQQMNRCCTLWFFLITNRHGWHSPLGPITRSLSMSCQLHVTTKLGLLQETHRHLAQEINQHCRVICGGLLAKYGRFTGMHVSMPEQAGHKCLSRCKITCFTLIPSMLECMYNVNIHSPITADYAKALNL